jgi:hypothetical protein
MTTTPEPNADDIAALVREAFRRGHTAGYLAATADGSQEIQTPNLDHLRARGLDVPGPRDPAEAELQAIIAAAPGDEIGVIREDGGLDRIRPHYLGCSEPLRDVMAASLAHADHDPHGWRAVFSAALTRPDGPAYMAAMAAAASVALATVIEDEALEYGVHFACVAERLAAAAEDSDG